MFTGIVEEIGKVYEMKQVSGQEQAIQITIGAKKILTDVQIGDSIAVNGICLTVTTFQQDQFTVDVMPETMNATSLSSLVIGSGVNLERSLQATDRFGGHFVTGHIDGIGKITRKEPNENAVYFDIEMADELIKFMMLKGSVAIDGISLTIFGVDTKQNRCTISLIPHTMEVTILGEKKVSDIVNIECDMLAKHVQHYMGLQVNN